MGVDDQEVGKIKLFLFKKFYITLGALLVIAVSIIGGIYKYVYMQIDNSQLKNELDIQKTDNAKLNSELDSLKEKLNLEERKIPFIKYPLNGSNLIGSSVDLEWLDKNHNIFCVEIIRIDQSGEIMLFPEVNGQKRTLIVGQDIEPGKYIWRVFPEESDYPKESIAFNYFTIYKTTLDRIKNTKTLLIGSTPSQHGLFNSYCKGKQIGFEIDFVKNIIVKELEKKLGIANGELKYKFVKIVWSKLLPELQNKNYDVAISSMTATEKRESNYKPVKFTKGYFETHQIIIGLKENSNSLGDILKGKKIGVIPNTTNEDAANFLANRFKFKVVKLSDEEKNNWYDFDSFFSPLNRSDIDFALVDEIYFKEFFNKDQDNKQNIYQIGPYLDVYLGAFFDKYYGKGKRDEYSIAVTDEKLLKILNEIIETNKDHLFQMKKNILNYRCN